jgi:hypothetical protein
MALVFTGRKTDKDTYRIQVVKPRKFGHLEY